jgi:quercetin dioxygenase-like cupin family protein
MNTALFNNLNWLETPFNGITKAVCGQHEEGGDVAYWCVPKGSGFADHGHKGFEYTCVISGLMRFGENTLYPKDIICTYSGERHSATALEDSIILVIKQRTNQ